VYNTKQRHYTVLVSQMNDYTNNNNTTTTEQNSNSNAAGGGEGSDTNLNLLMRQISIFRPFLMDAKAKMEEMERKLHAISLRANFAKTQTTTGGTTSSSANATNAGSVVANGQGRNKMK